MELQDCALPLLKGKPHTHIHTRAHTHFSYINKHWEIKPDANLKTIRLFIFLWKGTILSIIFYSSYTVWYNSALWVNLLCCAVGIGLLSKHAVSGLCRCCQSFTLVLCGSLMSEALKAPRITTGCPNAVQRCSQSNTALVLPWRCETKIQKVWLEIVHRVNKINKCRSEEKVLTAVRRL